MNTFAEETKNSFEHTLDWLKQWACSRTYGLGSKLPWDQQYLIESLSDSTIYMAYYTIAHLIQGGVHDGSAAGPAQIKPEQLTAAVFDYIFLNKDYPADCGIEESILKKLRNEFEFWYPMDLRVSGKDLIPNHLTFCIYNHVAIWDKDESKWPLGIRGNGHLLLNNAKMSKQTGNFLTISDSISLFGADATRIALAHAGDGLSDANFESSNANKAVLDLYNAITWAQEILNDNETVVDREVDSLGEDKTFDSAINKIIQQTDVAYSKLHFREALLYAFYELRYARDAYRVRVGAKKMNRALVRKFIETQALLMVPIVPHWAEQVWELLGNKGLIVHASFPVPGPIDEILLAQEAHLLKCRDEFAKKAVSSKQRNPKLNKATIYVATKFPEWHVRVVQIATDNFNENNGVLDVAKITAAFKTDDAIKKNMKLAVPFIKEIAVCYFISQIITT